MGKIYDGEITLHFLFHDLLVEEGDTLIDALFPEGFEGELMGISSEKVSCEDEETGAKIEP